MKRLGIFGGTFNPPHNGHVSAAANFVEQMKLDELLIVPTFIPPHKQYHSSVTCEERLRMCELAFSTVKGAKVSDIEIKRGGASYTYITLRELSADDVELYFLCGTDMILSMDTWRNPEEIFALAKICYVRRENDSDNSDKINGKCQEYRAKFGAEIHQICGEVVDISSSSIREMTPDLHSYLPDAVYEYITEMGLYK